MNKPYDRSLKDFAGTDPRLLLHILGILPMDAKATIETMRTETSPPVVVADFVARLYPEDGSPSVLHTEFDLHYRSGAPRRMARYGISLALEHEEPVESFLVVVRREGAPEVIPEVGEYVVGKTRAIHPYTVIRMWESDPGPILASPNREVLPWAAIMKSSDEQVRKIAEEVVASRNRERLAWFLLIGSIRYDRNLLVAMTKGVPMRLIDDILEESWLVRDIKEAASKAAWEKGLAEGKAKGEAEGQAEGEAKGRVEEARRLLRTLLAAKFPGLESMPELDAIQDLQALETLLIDHVIASSDRARIEHAVRAAAGANG